MRTWTFCVAAVCGFVVSTVAAQDAPTEEFLASRFTPAVGPGNYLSVDGALVSGHLAPSALLLVDYAHRPFVVFEADCNGQDDEDCTLGEANPIVAYQLTTHVGASLSLADRVQFGFILPVVATAGDGYHASRGAPDRRPVRILGGKAFSLSDPRLSAKVQLVGVGGKGPMLAAVAYGTAPFGRRLAPGRGVGYDGFTAGGHMSGEYLSDVFRAAINLGGVWRPKSELLSTESGSELTYGAAAAIPVTSVVTLGGELNGTTRLSTELDENSLEARIFGRLELGDFQLNVAAGGGIVGGAGIPNFRALAGVTFAPQSLDSDGDGVRDVDDRCPGAVEDLDGYLDDDGCPELDNDADGLADDVDQCPDDPEDMDGNDDADGCPDRDNDGDGIQDGYDSCPEEAEDMDGDRDDDGCPDRDRDRDGVEDDVDQCPDDPEDTDGFADEDGCPEADFDGDGLPDDEDECPDEPETINGFEDEDGCPEAPQDVPAMESP